MPERRTTAAVGRLAVSLLLLTIPVACTSSQAATGNTVTFYIFNEPGGSFVRAARNCRQPCSASGRLSADWLAVAHVAQAGGGTRGVAMIGFRISIADA